MDTDKYKKMFPAKFAKKIKIFTAGTKDTRKLQGISRKGAKCAKKNKTKISPDWASSQRKNISAPFCTIFIKPIFYSFSLFLKKCLYLPIPHILEIGNLFYRLFLFVQFA